MSEVEQLRAENAELRQRLARVRFLLQAKVELWDGMARFYASSPDDVAECECQRNTFLILLRECFPEAKEKTDG